MRYIVCTCIERVLLPPGEKKLRRYQGEELGSSDIVLAARSPKPPLLLFRNRLFVDISDSKLFSEPVWEGLEHMLKKNGGTVYLFERKEVDTVSLSRNSPRMEITFYPLRLAVRPGVSYVTFREIDDIRKSVIQVMIHTDQPRRSPQIAIADERDTEAI